jgi:Amt family ammonium transporter
VHGVNGLWGILSLGLLADGTYGAGWNGVDGNVTGLFYGDAGQFVAQLIGGAVNIVFVGLLTLVAYGLTSLITGGQRVSAEVEDAGLDIPEMGVLAYPEGVSPSEPAVAMPATTGASKRAAA